jgi:signal transduction histidine kinase
MIKETGCQTQDRLLAMIAHDLQTPLAAVIITAAELSRTGDAYQRRAAERVLSCAERMKRMTVDLLDYGCARCSGGLPVRPERVDLAELARDAGWEVEASHPGSHVCLEVEGDVRGEWDPTRMAQVLVNLARNAVEHGARGGGPVEIRLVRQPDWVRIEVVNQGEPIPEDEMPRLFEPFASGPCSRSRRESVGLGLFIVSEIVAAHGGDVRAFNSPEAGTVTFAVRLPLPGVAPERAERTSAE